MKKITKLTPEQIGRFREWTQKWVEIGLSTEPADFEAATAAALEAYRLCNLKRPLVILRMGSPFAATMGGAIAWAMLKGKAQARAQVWDQARAQVWDQARAQVRDQVGDQVGAQVRDQVGAQVWAQVQAQVWDQARAQVWDQVGAQVWAQVWDQVWDQVGAITGNSFGGSLYAQLDAYISFFRDVCDWENDTLKKFEIGESLTGSCGWCWWHENVLAISDRPASISRDDRGRLHNETGPSMLYRDGWALWNWHGVTVPSEWITNRASLTAKAALAEENLEKRRAACEILGWGNILKELKGKTINRDPDPQIGELIEVTLPGSGKERFLRVQCGTLREFVIPVPPTMKTALSANCWTYDIPEQLMKLKESRT